MAQASVAGSGAAAHERLRHAIVRLELEPGAPVSEAQLVARFGFSKAAVRAALARLRAERLVLAEPRRGHVIAPLTIRDVGEIYDLRLLLEPPAAAAAAGPDRARRARAPARALGARARPRRPGLGRSLHGGQPRGPRQRGRRRRQPPGGAHRRAAAGRQRARPPRRPARRRRRPRPARARRAPGAAGALEAGDGDEAARLMAAAIRAFRDELLDALRSRRGRRAAVVSAMHVSGPKRVAVGARAVAPRRAPVPRRLSWAALLDRGEHLLAARTPSLAPPSMKPWKSCELCSPAKWMLPCATPS